MTDFGVKLYYVISVDLASAGAVGMDLRQKSIEPSAA